MVEPVILPSFKVFAPPSRYSQNAAFLLRCGMCCVLTTSVTNVLFPYPPLFQRSRPKPAKQDEVRPPDTTRVHQTPLSLEREEEKEQPESTNHPSTPNLSTYLPSPTQSHAAVCSLQHLMSSVLLLPFRFLKEKNK